MTHSKVDLSVTGLENRRITHIGKEKTLPVIALH
jgi:hypothetical protein